MENKSQKADACHVGLHNKVNCGVKYEKRGSAGKITKDYNHIFHYRLRVDTAFGHTCPKQLPRAV